jgi:hypothetical protein
MYISNAQNKGCVTHCENWYWDSLLFKKKFDLKHDSQTVNSPYEVANIFHSCFSEIREKFQTQNNTGKWDKTAQVS